MPGAEINFLNPFHSLRRLAGVDKAVFYSILSRVFSTAGSLITVPLILTRLNPAEQGFYYTFGSILALQVFLEMGFGTVAIQLVAHEAGHLNLDLKAGITGPADQLQKFYATVRFIRNWYAVVALLVGLLLFPAGAWFFSTSAGGASASWFLPWTIMVFSAAGAVFVNSLGSVIEGMGFVAESIRVRLWGGGAQILLSIAGLLAGFKLYAAPVAGTAALLINFWLIWRLLRNVLLEAGRQGKNVRIDWFNEVFPFQWRIALSWISGWFIFSAMLPVVFRQLGPAEAGRFGLAMSISSFISAFATNWTSTKAAIWGQMAARRDWQAMDRLFWKVMPQATGVALAASAAALLLVPHLAQWIPRFAGRLPDGRILLLLCSSAVLNQVIFAQAYYLRAHKREPFLANSVFVALAMCVALFGFTYSSALSISAIYAGLSVVGLAWGCVLFVTCRARWHTL